MTLRARCFLKKQLKAALDPKSLYISRVLCVKVQKYEKGKIDLQFLDMCC